MTATISFMTSYFATAARNSGDLQKKRHARSPGSRSQKPDCRPATPVRWPTRSSTPHCAVSTPTACGCFRSIWTSSRPASPRRKPDIHVVKDRGAGLHDRRRRRARRTRRADCRAVRRLSAPGIRRRSRRCPQLQPLRRGLGLHPAARPRRAGRHRGHVGGIPGSPVRRRRAAVRHQPDQRRRGRRGRRVRPRHGHQPGLLR